MSASSGLARLRSIVASTSRDATALAALLAFALLHRLVVLDLPHNNGDALRKWMWARVVRQGWSPSTALWEGWDHHAARLGINLPTLAVQSVFGDHPALYYVTPLGAHLVAVACLFRIGLCMAGRGVALVAAGAWTWLVPSYWSAQLMPAAFSPAYVLLTIVCLLEVTRRDAERQRWIWLALASVGMMVAELTKVTNLFFMPGLMVALYAATRRVKLTLALGAMVSLLMLVELAAYRLSSLDAPLGRASIIVANHLHGNAAHKFKAIDGLWGLITRQAPAFGKVMPGLYLWLFLPLGGLCAWRFRKLGPAPQLVVAATLSYLLFHVFAIRSLDPIMSVQPPGRRYLAVVLPLCLLALTWAAGLWLRPMAPPEWAPRGDRFAAAMALALLSHAVLSHGSDLSRHPLVLLHRYDRMFDQAYREGTPIVSLSPARYGLHGSLCLFWDGLSSPTRATEQRVPPPGSARFPARKIKGRKKLQPGKKFRFIYDPERAGGLKGYRLVRTWKGRDALVIAHKGSKLSMRRRSFDSLHDRRRKRRRR